MVSRREKKRSSRGSNAVAGGSQQESGRSNGLGLGMQGCNACGPLHAPGRASVDGWTSAGKCGTSRVGPRLLSSLFVCLWCAPKILQPAVPRGAGSRPWVKSR
eukprot:364328-Chlamydomonas_euryale.AAC.1